MSSETTWNLKRKKNLIKCLILCIELLDQTIMLEREPIWRKTLRWQLWKLSTLSLRNVSTGNAQSKIFRKIQKIWGPNLQETVQPLLSWWGWMSCEQNSDQKFQNKVYCLFFLRKFLKTGVLIFEIFLSKQTSINQVTNAQN